MAIGADREILPFFYRRKIAILPDTVRFKAKTQAKYHIFAHRVVQPRMFPFRQPLFSICLSLVIAGTAESADWNVLHSESDARVVVHTLHEEISTLNLQLPDNKSCITFGTPISFPLVLDDLNPSIRLRADQPGVAVGAQVVLPRTIHPHTQRPVTYVVPGTRYSGSGSWETLGFWDRNGTPNLRAESDKIARLLQAELGITFDTRGQYIRQIVFYAERLPQYGEMKRIDVTSPSVTEHIAADVGATERELVFDPLNYVGFKIQVSARPISLQGNTENTEWVSPLQSHTAAPLVATPNARPTMRTAYSGEDPTNYTLTNQNVSLPSPASAVRIRFHDGVLRLDDVPIGVRAIEYRGESLAFLRSLQFNAVWLKDAPSPELRLEAQQAGIWLICPPPSNTELETARVYDANTAPGRSNTGLDSSYDNVLVWNLGDEGSHARYSADAQRAQTIKNADQLKRRPLLGTARSGVYEYSRTLDILMLSREPLFSSLDLIDLHTWQKEYQSLARFDSAFWSIVQTQPSERLTQQWTMFEGNPAFISAISYEQIKMQVYLALASGARGILFKSNSPLTNNDIETEFRRTALELANWELQLVEEWFSAGQVSPMSVRSTNQPLANSAVIQAGKSRLLVPIWQERQNQSAVGPAVAGNVRYVVAGIPEGYNAFHLVPGRAMPMHAPRTAGGHEIILKEASLNSLIFFSGDDATHAHVGQRASMMGQRTAYLACRLAELELAMTEQVLAALKRAKDTGKIPIHADDNIPLIAMPEYETMLRTTRDALELAKNLANTTPPDYAQAYLQAERSTRGLRFVGRSLWQEATRYDLHPCMTPVSVSFATLPLYLAAYQRTHGATLGQNRLPGGNMEIRALQQAGWEAMSHKVDGTFVARNGVAPEAARSGQLGLSLVVAPTTPEDKPKILETIPLWITTPAMPIRMGEMICVSGWIRIPQPLESTVDGLMIFDSLGGEQLALRFLHTNGEWREFAFYRIVPENSNYYVIFALNGLGEVHLDDIQVSAVQFAAPQVPAQPAPSGTTPYWQWQRANPFRYLPPLPNWGQ